MRFIQYDTIRINDLKNSHADLKDRVLIAMSSSSHIYISYFDTLLLFWFSCGVHYLLCFIYRNSTMQYDFNFVAARVFLTKCLLEIMSRIVTTM